MQLPISLLNLTGSLVSMLSRRLPILYRSNISKRNEKMKIVTYPLCDNSLNPKTQLMSCYPGVQFICSGPSCIGLSKSYPVSWHFCLLSIMKSPCHDDAFCITVTLYWSPAYSFHKGSVMVFYFSVSLFQCQDVGDFGHLAFMWRHCNDKVTHSIYGDDFNKPCSVSRNGRNCKI